MLLSAPTDFVLPPLPSVEVATPVAPNASTADDIIEEWSKTLVNGTENLRVFTNKIEHEALAFMQDAIECGPSPSQTNVQYVVEKISTYLKNTFPELRVEIEKARTSARSFATTKDPRSRMITIKTGDLYNCFQNTEETFKSIAEQGRRIIRRFTNSDYLPERRSISIYESALKASLKNENNVSWELKYEKYPDEYELIPWIELNVTREIRRDRIKKKEIEDRINSYISDVDPNLVGSIAINFRTQPTSTAQG